MFSLRGDVHKFYLKLKKTLSKNKSINKLREIEEINEIRQFYQTLTVSELTNIRYKMIKEQNGMGIIPLLFGSLPWLGFIFSRQLQIFLFKDGAHIWLWFIIGYSLILFLAFLLHYRERAWASLHIEIIEDILSERTQN